VAIFGIWEKDALVADFAGIFCTKIEGNRQWTGKPSPFLVRWSGIQGDRSPSFAMFFALHPCPVKVSEEESIRAKAKRQIRSYRLTGTGKNDMVEADTGCEEKEYPLAAAAERGRTVQVPAGHGRRRLLAAGRKCPAGHPRYRI